MLKRYFFILLIFFIAINSGCEDDPVLEDSSTSDDKGSYGKQRLDNNATESDSEKNEENHELF